MYRSVTFLLCKTEDNVLDANQFVTFSALGNGWDLAIFDSVEELAFIREAQKRLGNINDYWIGGFTDSESGRIIQYSAYSSKSGQ